MWYGHVRREDKTNGSEGNNGLESHWKELKNSPSKNKALWDEMDKATEKRQLEDGLQKDINAWRKEGGHIRRNAY